MAVILIFLALGAVIILFFGELMFTVAALALLTAFFVSRLDLSGTWVDRAWIFMTAPPISLPAAVLWASYFTIGALLLWMLTGNRFPRFRAKELTPDLVGTASETPVIVDMARLEEDLSQGGPLGQPAEGLEAAQAS